MGKSAPTPPPAPDPTAIAAAQSAANRQSAITQSQLNSPNINSAYGNITSSFDPTSNQWTYNQTLSPAEQAVFDAGTANQAGALNLANGDLSNVQQALAHPVNPITPLATGVNQGPIQYGFQQGPQLQYGFNQGGQVQGQVNTPAQSQAIQQAQNAAYQGQTQYLDPQWAQNAEHQQAQLVAQGLNPNDAAYQNSMQLFDNSRNQAYGNAQLQAVQAGNAEQNTLYGQDLSSGQFANSAQSQAYGENQGQAAFGNAAAGQQYAQNQGAASFGNTAQQQAFGQGQQNASLYNSAANQDFQNRAYAQELPINEFTALQANSQVQQPQLQQPQTSVAPTDVTGAYALQQQALQQDYQSQMQNYQSGLGGLFNLGGSALMAGATFFSDARLKRDVTFLAKWRGHNLYGFRYLWDDVQRVGVLAQEILRSRPEAVIAGPGGLLAVNYGAL